ncbi:hypothetical protein D3C87_1542510 [compost metagenome]
MITAARIELTELLVDIKDQGWNLQTTGQARAVCVHAHHKVSGASKAEAKVFVFGVVTEMRIPGGIEIFASGEQRKFFPETILENFFSHVLLFRKESKKTQF